MTGKRNATGLRPSNDIRGFRTPEGIELANAGIRNYLIRFEKPCPPSLPSSFPDKEGAAEFRAAAADRACVRSTARYLLRTDVHTFAFSVAANAILSFFPFLLLLMTLIRHVFHSQVMYGVVESLLRDSSADRAGVRDPQSECAGRVAPSGTGFFAGHAAGEFDGNFSCRWKWR